MADDEKDDDLLDKFFDAGKGERLKEEGMALAASSKEELLEIGREIARARIYQVGHAHIDDVYAGLYEIGVDPDQLGNAAGSIFKPKEFVPTGEWRKSTRISNHGHKSQVWTMKNINR